MAAQKQATSIELYTAGTPNGHKINILMEELALTYNVHSIAIAKNEQKQDWYLRINPNGRIPAIVDKTDGAERRLFEGGATMLYLVEKYDEERRMGFDYGTDEYWEMVCWITWMQSGIGPMQGQANHFYRYAPEKIQYGIDRYQTETKRLYQVLEDRLAEQQNKSEGLWIVGGKYTIADLACFSWINWAEWAGVPTGPFPNIEKWMKAINDRPATQRGVNIPEEFEMKKAMKTKEGEEEYAKHHSNWVMQGQKADQERHK